MLKEILEKIDEGSREQAKKAYLTPKYDIKDVEAKIKKAKSGGTGRAYIQYADKKSRSGISGGHPIEINKGKVVVANPYGDGTVEVDPKDISMLDIIKGK